MNRHVKVPQERYAERELAVAALGELEQPAAADLADLDYLGRYKVADEHWNRCDASARSALLGDGHHFVSSCARIARDVEGMPKKGHASSDSCGAEL